MDGVSGMSKWTILLPLASGALSLRSSGRVGYVGGTPTLGTPVAPPSPTVHFSRTIGERERDGEVGNHHWARPEDSACEGGSDKDREEWGYANGERGSDSRQNKSGRSWVAPRWIVPWYREGQMPDGERKVPKGG